MVSSTIVQSKRSKRKSSSKKDSLNVTSLLALEDGHSPSESAEYQTINLYGQEAVHASHLATLETRWVSLIHAIYSRRSAALSRAADLQSSLASRLQASLDVNGSPEYVLKWHTWDMPQGGAIFALRGSRRRTSDKDFSGWPTPKTSDEKGGMLGRAFTNRSNLNDKVQLAPWPTPMAGSQATEKNNAGGNTDSSRKIEELAGWATPTSRDYKDGDCCLAKNPDNSLLGRQALLASNAQTGKRGALNPKFSLWLQGYPETWALSGARAMLSIRGLRPNSLNHK